MVLAQLPLLSVWYLFILLPRWGWEKLHLYQAALCISAASAGNDRDLGCCLLCFGQGSEPATPS